MVASAPRLDQWTFRMSVMQEEAGRDWGQESREGLGEDVGVIILIDHLSWI